MKDLKILSVLLWICTLVLAFIGVVFWLTKPPLWASICFCGLMFAICVLEIICTYYLVKVERELTKNKKEGGQDEKN